MARKMDPVAVMAANCLLAGADDQTARQRYRRFRRKLLARYKGHEVDRMIGAARAQLAAERV